MSAPDTRPLLTAWEAIAITRGRVVRQASAIDRPITGAAIDSREVRPGDLFVALPGARTDGHRHVADALARGAALALVTRPSAVEPAPPRDAPGGILAVADVRAALAVLAARARDRLTSPVIAVTGSCGKTTTVRLLDAVLRARGPGSASSKSFNNDLGVPLALLNAARTDAFVVCEVGTNARGEIASLARIIRPDAAVITMVGRAHLGGFASRDELRREKGDLAAFVRPPGVVVVGADAPPTFDRVPVGVAVVRFGVAPEADVRVTRIAPDDAGVGFELTGEPTRFRVPLFGAHNACNAAAAVIIAQRLGLPPDRIAERLRHAQAPPMRMQVREVGGVRVINDAYNANPESMLAALRTLPDLARGPCVAVLGDMRELGDETARAHSEVLAAARAAGLARLVAVGAEMSAAAARAGLDAEAWPACTGDAARAIALTLRAGDTVLLKGSRAMGLEAIEHALAALVPASVDGRSE